MTSLSIVAIVVMALLLAFSLIHLGVSIGIIAQFRKYGNFFRPQIGLAGFNLVISFFGLAAGGLGLAAIMTKKKSLGIIAAVAAAITGIFALASLVSALVINAKSLSYVSSRFHEHLINYKTIEDSRIKIDLIQSHYTCCGIDTWLDWSMADLNGTSPMTTTTNMNTATTVPTTSQASDTTDSSATTNSNVQTSTASNSRRKRQVMPPHNSIEYLIITYGVTLPKTCCSSNAIFTDTVESYCISNANNTVNSFYPIGCAKQLDIVAGNQAMGFGVINSFIIVLAFVAIPLALLAGSAPMD
ncbi:unnamed protein product [Rotaria sp. Silwood1]|nr:unnamed protein product [Rotaria sp. Silwood1]